MGRRRCAPHFDLTKGPLLRANLLRFGETEHVLLLTIHHIISDGWSVGVFVRELAALYEAYAAGRASPLRELSIQYADFAGWQRSWLQGERLKSNSPTGEHNWLVRRRFSNYQPIGHARRCNLIKALTKLCSYASL